jgi:LPXTG-site transpeptidase (sortase) family protein
MKKPATMNVIIGLLAFSLGGLIGPLSTTVRLETFYQTQKAKEIVKNTLLPTKIQLPPAVPMTYDPLVSPDGSSITPINTDFAIIVPKIGINAPVIADVDPLNPKAYALALSEGVAHSNLSYLPNENGTVYLFSHSTNYEWFVKDLNAVFYLLKNLENGDSIVLMYKGVRYTYELNRVEIVKPEAISYLLPQSGVKSLILQTCWPPGSTTERMLLFADLIDETKIN